MTVKTITKTGFLLLVLALLELPAAGDQIQDPQITRGVRAVLAADRRVRGTQVDVSTTNGWVTLRGEVGSLAEKVQAEKLAKKVKGVRGIRNFIRLRVLVREDRDIEVDVRQRLAGSNTVPLANLTVDAEHGVVTLTGHVETWAQSRQAELVASEVGGVGRVRNQLVIATDALRIAAQEIQAEVEGHLKRDAYLTDLPIKITVENGNVTMIGDVNSLFQRERAAEEARRLPGVKSVKNRLALFPWRDLNRAFEPLGDRQIEILVRKELASDPRIDATGLSIAVSDRSVFLRGNVANLYEKELAERVCRSVIGVLHVDSQLQVTTTPRKAPRIQADVQSLLASDSLLGGNRISVAVSEGRVTLSGQVKDHWSKNQAARLAGRVRGVRSVVNELQVATSNELDDDAITRLVVGRVAVNWATRPVADRITVRTENGVVILAGELPSWTQRAEAERAARFTTGVRRVDNQLTVATP